MTENAKQMTAGTSSQMSRAAEIARARRIADGRDPDAPTRGPMAEMMRDSGMSAERIRATGRFWAATGEMASDIVGPAKAAAFVATFAAVADEMDAAG